MNCIRNAQAPTGLYRTELGGSDVPPTEHFGYNPLQYHDLGRSRVLSPSESPNDLQVAKKQGALWLSGRIGLALLP